MTLGRIALLQHHPAEGPGRIAAWARTRAIELVTFFPEQAPCPAPESGFDALILLGGPHGANDRVDWLACERDATARWLASGKPILGICLGAQILAQALGASVQAMPARELGWIDIQWTDGGSQPFLQWHADAFTLPPGARVLATSAANACQAFDHGAHRIGLQFHPEWDAALVDTLHAAFGADCPLPRTEDAARQDAVGAWFGALLDRWIATAAALEALALD
jgi:GMP synthase-like glutamine amidotransferase